MTNPTEATISARLAGHTDSAVRVIISKAVESYLTGRQEEDGDENLSVYLEAALDDAAFAIRRQPLGSSFKG